MCTVGPVRFTGFLNAFRVSHPGVELTLIEGVSSELKDLLRTGDLDVAIISDPDGFEPPLHASVLYEEPFVLACGPTHAFAARSAITPEDLEGEIYLQRIHCEYRDRLAQMLVERGVTIRRAHRSEREDWIQSMVAAGMGVCFLPSFSATVPGLVQLPVVDPEVTREVCIVTIARRRSSPPMAALLSALDGYAWTNEVGRSDATPAGTLSAAESVHA
jgi:LysR family hydrogen peroxide-inducible transcriptional activator